MIADIMYLSFGLIYQKAAIKGIDASTLWMTQQVHRYTLV